MKKYTLITMIIALTAASANAQFPIKIPKISIPKVEQPKTEQPTHPSQPSQAQRPNNPQNNSVSNNNSQPGTSKRRQMVMDDGFTFFGAEPVEEYDSKASLNKDIGWYLESKLRLLGTFPKRSAFRIAVVKNRKQLSIVRCDLEGTEIYRQSEDSHFLRPRDRAGRDLSFDDFASVDFKCQDKKAVNKEIGKVNIKVYFIDGETDAETLVRTYEVDVHRTSKVRGANKKPQPDVSDYYIQRHAEAAVAFAYFVHQANGYSPGSYFSETNQIGNNTRNRRLTIYTTYSPPEKNPMLSGHFARCTVNGKKITFKDDTVGTAGSGGWTERGTHIDRLIPKYQRGGPYSDRIEFSAISFSLPIYTEEGTDAKPPMEIKDHPGKWECSVINAGVTLRIFRWEVANGKIVPHAEQKNGNINLFFDAAMIEMEIPVGGSPLDRRLMPMPEMGLFYGIPWTTAEGKAMAERVPKVGNPYPVPSTQEK